MTLQEIKRRRESVKKTRKITKAMQLVATAKIRRAKKNLDGIQEYYNEVNSTFSRLMEDVNDISRLFPQQRDNANAFIVITSDLGLCGAYNANVLRMLKEKYVKNDFVYMIGNKGIAYCYANDVILTRKFDDIGDKIDYLIPNAIAESVIDLFMRGKIQNTYLIYTKFVNSVTFETRIKTILPIEVPPINVLNTIQLRMKSVVDIEPNPYLILKTALPLYVSALIYGTAIESKLSEMSSRRSAMENATDNADELLDSLNIIFNRARQAKITQEISEIVAGADSI